MNSKVGFLLRRLCSQFFSFTRALCTHNGRSLQEKNWRSLLANNQLLNPFWYILAMMLFCCSAFAKEPTVLLGVDVFFKEKKIAELKGKRIGLITNQTGVDGKMR